MVIKLKFIMTKETNIMKILLTLKFFWFFAGKRIVSHQSKYDEKFSLLYGVFISLFLKRVN